MAATSSTVVECCWWLVATYRICTACSRQLWILPAALAVMVWVLWYAQAWQRGLLYAAILAPDVILWLVASYLRGYPVHPETATAVLRDWWRTRHER